MASNEKLRGPKPKVINFVSEEGEFVLTRDNAQEYIQDRMEAVGLPDKDQPKLSDKKYAAERPESYSALNVDNYTTIRELAKLLRIIASGTERELSEE